MIATPADPRAAGPERAAAPAREGALRWIGPGALAFVGTPAAAPSGGEPGGEWQGAGPFIAVTAARREELAGVIGTSAGMDAAAAAAEFLDAGGRECLVADLSWLEGVTPPAGREPGILARAAVTALSEMEEVGTIILLGEASPAARDLALETAGRREDLLFLLEGRGGERVPGLPPAAPPRGQSASPPADEAGPSLLFLRENAAVLRSTGGARAGTVTRSLGRLAGYLQSSDFAEEPRYFSSSSPRRPKPPAWLRESDRIALESWRRREGLRRSIDLGTRWVLFEVHHPLLRRRIEREVTGFLRRLEAAGFLDRGGGEPAFEVACRSGEGGTGRLTVSVRARIAG